VISAVHHHDFSIQAVLFPKWICGVIGWSSEIFRRPGGSTVSLLPMSSFPLIRSAMKRSRTITSFALPSINRFSRLKTRTG
jgi:hypothetical protein